MTDRLILWIFGAGFGVIMLALGYLTYEYRDLRKRFHTRNNDLAELLTKIQLDNKGVSDMASNNKESLDEIKGTVETLRETLERLGNELARLSGLLSKGK